MAEEMIQGDNMNSVSLLHTVVAMVNSLFVETPIQYVGYCHFEAV